MRLEKVWWARLGGVMLALVVLGFVGTLRPMPAHATTFQLIATVERAQAQNTCAGTSAATGSAFMTYNDATNLLTWSITFSGTSTTPNLAHFHGPAAKGVEGGVQVTIGSSSPSAGSATITQMQEADLLANLWYINFHTAMCPSGEIRGQVRQAGVGGLAGAPDLDTAPLGIDDSSGTSTGLIAAIAAGIAVLGVLTGGATLAWRRRVR